MRARVPTRKIHQPTDRPLVTLLTGGSEAGSLARVAAAVRSGFAASGHRLDVVHVEAPREETVENATRVIKLGSPRLRASLPAISRYLRSAKPVMTLAMPAELAVLAVPLGRLAGCDVVPWETSHLRRLLVDDPLLGRRFRVVPALQRLTYPTAAAIAVTSLDIGRDLRELLAGHEPAEGFTVIPNPVDADRIRDLAAVPMEKRGFRFCAMGRLSYNKGYDVLLEAAALAAPRLPPDWELVVLGEGPARLQLEEQRRRLGLDLRVTLPGFAKNPFPMLASADVFVHPSRHEGFVLVVSEALALGVPVIATASPGGPIEILGGGEAGMLVPVDDASALAEAMVDLASNDPRRQSLAAQAEQRIADYLPERIAQRMIALAHRLQHRR